MSESRSHVDLVKTVYEYVKTIVPFEKQALIEVDSADSFRPTSVNGKYIPDVQYWGDDMYIIGEAKTINDFDREHSRLQYIAYMEETQKFCGKSIIVIAVPWQLVFSAKNHFRRLKRQNGYRADIIVLDEMGGQHLL